jgi:7-cyano-7-deazaguanine synthase
MLSIATGIAVAEGADAVATGVHGGDHFIYPDCRPDFIMLMNRAMGVGNEGFAVSGFSIEAPFLHLGKHDIVAVGMGLGVDFVQTWSCYKGGENHCGKCGTCVERKEAFELAGFDDPTLYDG